jgi:agmatine deiminase
MDHGFRMPAERDAHAGTWIAWPSHADLWGEALDGVRAAFVDMASALAGDSGRDEELFVLVPDDENESLAREALARFDCRFHRIPFGDIWMRDTAPVFLVNGAGEVAAASFVFNGWGGKYALPGDTEVSARVATASGAKTIHFEWVLEGGAVEVDGEGTCLTTRQCLLNRNRNPTLSPEEIEKRVKGALGVSKVLWLDEGLKNDHTDGHVDTLARFVAPGVALCMEPQDDDPNRAALEKILKDLRSFTDANGRKLEVFTLPSPGRVVDRDERLMPASYANYYVGNGAVVVPVYGVPEDEDAVRRVAALYPGRNAVPVPAKELLEGGGAFHCITQQMPKGNA